MDPKKQNAVIMGRKTWESIPEAFRPLPGRVNVVLSRQQDASYGDADSVVTAGSLQEGLEKLQGENIERVFVIGGGEVYKEAMASDDLIAIHVTIVESDDIECDTFMPPVDDSVFKVWSASEPRRDTPDGLRYSFVCYTRCDGIMEDDAVVQMLPPGVKKLHEEYQYLDMIQEIINEGVHRGDRTGTGTFSKFGKTMRFNLRHTFPLLTTKRVFWRGRSDAISFKCVDLLLL